MGRMCPLQLQVNFNSGSYVTIPTTTHFFSMGKQDPFQLQSVNLPKQDRREMGLYDVADVLSLSCFNIGMRMEVFKSSGKIPLAQELFNAFSNFNLNCFVNLAKNVLCMQSFPMELFSFIDWIALSSSNREKSELYCDV